MASCNSQEVVVDSGVDSEATTPSSPEDDSQEDIENNKSKQEQMSDEMVLETAETLLALSGKKSTSTAIVLPQQPPNDLQKGRI